MNKAMNIHSEYTQQYIVLHIVYNNIHYIVNNGSRYSLLRWNRRKMVHVIDIMRNKQPEMVYRAYNLPTQGVYGDSCGGGG